MFSIAKIKEQEQEQLEQVNKTALVVVSITTANVWLQLHAGGLFFFINSYSLIDYTHILFI